MKKLILLIALLSFLSVTLTTCDTINDWLNDDNDPPETEYTFDLYTHPGDPSLMKATGSDGTEIMFFGTKDAEGAADKVNFITVKYPDDNSSYKIMVNEDGTPGKMFSTEGSAFEFTPMNDKEILVNVVSKTGEIRIRTKINLDSLEKSARQPGSGKPLVQYAFNRASATQYPAGFIPATPASSSYPGGNRAGASLVLKLSKCGHPLTSALALPVLIMKPPAGQEVVNCPAINGNGQYTFTLPDQSLPSAQIQKTCTKIGKAIDKLCLAASWAPWSVSTIINQLVQEQFPNATDKESITKVSNKVTKLVPHLCKIRDEVNVADFCEVVGEVYLNPNPDQYTYTMALMVPGGIVAIPVGSFDPNLGGTITYDIPGTFDVADLYTDPSDPGPSEGYTALAVIACPSPEGTEVTMSVVGSDGYTNSQTSTVAEPGTVTLYVPGGAQSVKDVITVTANGKSWSTYVVF